MKKLVVIQYYIDNIVLVRISAVFSGIFFNFIIIINNSVILIIIIFSIILTTCNKKCFFSFSMLNRMINWRKHSFYFNINHYVDLRLYSGQIFVEYCNTPNHCADTHQFMKTNLVLLQIFEIRGC